MPGRRVDLAVMPDPGAADILRAWQEVVVERLQPGVERPIQPGLQVFVLAAAAQIMHLVRVRLIVVKQPGTAYRADVGVLFGAQPAILGEPLRTAPPHRIREIEKRRGVAGPGLRLGTAWSSPRPAPHPAAGGRQTQQCRHDIRRVQRRPEALSLRPQFLRIAQQERHADGFVPRDSLVLRPCERIMSP